MSYECPHDAGYAVFNVENEVILLVKIDGYAMPCCHAQPIERRKKYGIDSYVARVKHDAALTNCKTSEDSPHFAKRNGAFALSPLFLNRWGFLYSPL